MPAILLWTDHHSIIFVEYRFLCCFSCLVVLSCLCACPPCCAVKQMTASWTYKRVLVSWLTPVWKFCSVALVSAVMSRPAISCSQCIISLSVACHICHRSFVWHVSRSLIKFFMIPYLLPLLPVCHVSRSSVQFFMIAYYATSVNFCVDS